MDTGFIQKTYLLVTGSNGEWSGESLPVAWLDDGDDNIYIYIYIYIFRFSLCLSFSTYIYIYVCVCVCVCLCVCVCVCVETDRQRERRMCAKGFWNRTCRKLPYFWFDWNCQRNIKKDLPIVFKWGVTIWDNKYVLILNMYFYYLAWKLFSLIFTDSVPGYSRNSHRNHFSWRLHL